MDSSDSPSHHLQESQGARSYPQPENSFSRGWLRLVTAIAAGLIAGIGLLFVLRYLARPMALAVLGVAIAAALAPLVGWLEQRMPRAVAIGLIYLAIALLMVGIGFAAIPPLIQQSREIGALAPDLIEQVQGLFNWESISNTSLFDTLLPQIGRFSSALVALPVTLATSIFEIILVLFISIYLLFEAPDMAGFVASLFPKDRASQVIDILSKMARSMGGYIRGSLINGAVIGILTYIGLLIIGVDFALVLGLLAGILEIVPFLGPILSSIPILIIALLESPAKALITLVFLVLLQQLEGNILTPNIMHSQTKVSPLLVLLAIMAGGTLGGLLGVLIAIPIAAALRVFVRHVIAPLVRRQTGAEAPANG